MVCYITSCLILNTWSAFILMCWPLLQVSTGIPSLDAVLGGGLPLGTLFLLEEDDHASYSEFFLRCFLAEGVAVGHETFVASLDKNPINIIKKLPSPLIVNNNENRSESHGNATKPEENMKIAWRYEQKKKHSNEISSLQIGHNFDLKTDMSDEMLSAAEKFVWGGVEKSYSYAQNKSTNPYRELFMDLNTLLTRRHLIAGNKRAQPNIMRIGIHSLASYSWGNELNLQTEDAAWSELTTFLTLLHALLRESYSVAFVSVPSHRFEDYNLMHRLSKSCDFVLGLESFQGTDKEVNPLFKDYHGLLKISKTCSLNSVVPPIINTKDWVFQVKRKRLLIEKLYLPPDLSETVSRSSSDPIKSSFMGCSSGGSSKLDF